MFSITASSIKVTAKVNTTAAKKSSPYVPSMRRAHRGSIDARARMRAADARAMDIAIVDTVRSWRAGRRAGRRARGRRAGKKGGDISHGKSSVGVAREMARWRGRRCATVAFWARAGSSIARGGEGC